MEKGNKLLSFLLFCMCLFCLGNIQAQNKTHFRVLENGIEVQNTICHIAAASLNMDLFRYTDIRRQIPVDGTSYTIELYSGQELWTTYQKRISPLNRPVAQDAYPNLHLVMSGNQIKIIP